MRPRLSPIPRSNRFCLEYLEDRTLLAGLTSPVTDPDTTQLANMDSATVARLILTTVSGSARVGIDSTPDPAGPDVTITISGIGPNSSIIIDTSRLDADTTHFSLESFTSVTIVGDHKLGSLAISDVKKINVQVPIVDMFAVSNSPTLAIVSAAQIVLTDSQDVSVVAGDFSGTTITADAMDLSLSSRHTAGTLTLFTLQPKATAELNFNVTDLVVSNFDNKDQIRFVVPPPVTVTDVATPAKIADPVEPAKSVIETAPTIEHIVATPAPPKNNPPTPSLSETPAPTPASGPSGAFVIENAVVLTAPSALNVTWLRIVPSVNSEIVTLLSGLKSDPDAGNDPGAGKTFIVKSTLPDPGPGGNVAFAPDPGLAPPAPAGQPVMLSADRSVAMPAPEHAASLVTAPVAPSATDPHHFLATDSTEDVAAMAAAHAAKAASIAASAVVATAEAIATRPTTTELLPGAVDRNNLVPVLADRSRTSVTTDPFFATAPPKSATSSLTPGLVTFLSRFIKSSDPTTQVFSLNDTTNNANDHRSVAVSQGDQMPSLAPGSAVVSMTEKSPFESLGNYIKTSLRETYAPGSAPVLLTQSPIGDHREEAVEPRDT